jgi:O-antigen/teichoic acid export membrane protein
VEADRLTSGSAEAISLPKRGGLAKNLLHLGFGQVATTVLTMLFSAAIARTLGASEFGLLYLLTSIAGFAYVFVDWGHGPYVTREVALRPARSGELIGSVLVVRVLTALMMCVVAVGFTWVLQYDVRTRFLAGLFIIAWIPQYLGLSYTWIFRGRERMEFDALLQVVLKGSLLIVAVTLLALGGRLLAVILGYAVAGTITSALAVITYRQLGFPSARICRATALELVRDGASILAISLVVAVQPSIDANILYKLVPQEVLGWHGTAWTIAGTLVAPATILGAAMYPRLSRAAADSGEFDRVLRTAFRPLFLVAVLGSGGTYLFADFAINVIYGRQHFGPAADILRAFAPALTLIYVDMLFGHAILAVHKAGQLAWAKAVAVIVTTAAEFLTVPWFQAHFANGGIGIVVALACGELVMVVASVILIRHAVHAGMLTDAIRGLVGGVLAIALMRALPTMSPLLGIPIFMLAFGLISVLVGSVTRADLDLLTGSFGKRRATNPTADAAVVDPLRPPSGP